MHTRFLRALLIAECLFAIPTLRADDGASKLGVIVNSTNTPTTSAGKFVIRQAGVYILNQDLTSDAATTGAMIAVQADNVTLDLNGHMISNGGTIGAVVKGIYGLDRKNVTIRNGGVAGFVVGVELAATGSLGATSYGNAIEDLSVVGSTWTGITMAGSDNIIRRCHVSNSGGYNLGPSDGNGYGILVKGGANVRVIENDVAGVFEYVPAFPDPPLYASYGIKLVSIRDGYVLSNRVSSADYGVYYEPSSTGKYRDNLVALGVPNLFNGGDNAGGNYISFSSWALDYFGDNGHVAAGLDTDGDGDLDSAEFAAGTDPTDRFDNAASRANPNGGISFTFSLLADYETSAGVYTTLGGKDYLVKTLWRSVPYKKGSHTAVWDGADDSGRRAATGTYKVKVQCSNMSYVWNGVIGNTSATFTGNVHQVGTGYGMNDLACDQLGMLYAAYGYSEGGYDVRKIATAAPQTPSNYIPAALSTSFALVAYDAGTVYAANVGDTRDSSYTTFVGKFNSNGVLSSSFAAKSNSPGPFWKAPTGLAVQHGTGSIVAVAYGASMQSGGSPEGGTQSPDGGKIEFFNKGSGAALAAVNSIVVDNPQRLAFGQSSGSNGGDLWAIVGNPASGGTASTLRVVKYSGAAIGGGSAPSVALTLSVTDPKGLAVSPDGNTILVADGGTEQRVKAFSGTTGALLWQLPSTVDTYKADATVPDPTVSAKFQFSDYVPLVFQDASSFWVGDSSPGRGGTGRVFHYSTAGVYLEHIGFMTANRTVACEPSEPTRVFWDFLEYQVDYSVPLLPGDPNASGGNGSWKLVRNWAPSSAPSTGSEDLYYAFRKGSGLNTVVKLTDGSGVSGTYAFATNPITDKNTLFELRSGASATLRSYSPEWAQDYRAGLNYGLFPNGDMRYSTWNGTSGVQQILRLPLTSIDPTTHQPTWGSPSAIATTSKFTKDLSNGLGFPGPAPLQFPITSNNVVVTFDSAEGINSSRGMRLGGSDASGGSGYLWKASPTVFNDVPLDGLGSYDAGDGVTSYGGNKVTSAERQIIYGFHGEFWNQGQANQFMHFTDDGLFVGQFGTPSRVENEVGPAIAGRAGNSFSPAFVRGTNGELYLYHNDESNHGGIHRWQLVGGGDLFSYTGSASVTTSPSVVTLSQGNPDAASLAPPAPRDLRITTTAAGSVNLSWSAAPGATTYNVKTSSSRGGPYTSISTAGTTATVSVVKDVFKYVCVSALDSSGHESWNSYEIKALAQDTTVPVGLAGCLVYRNWDKDFAANPAGAGFKVESHPPTDAYAVRIPKALDSLSPISPFNTTPTLKIGTLLRTAVGSRGGVIFGANGTTPILSNLVGATYALSADWIAVGLMNNSFSIDGSSRQNAGLHAENKGTGDGASNLDLTVTDPTKWYVLTVFSPEVSQNNQAANIQIMPLGSTTPVATFPFADSSVDGVTQGFCRIIQFRFKGSIRLNFVATATYSGSGGESPQNANLQAIFLDDATEILGP